MLVFVDSLQTFLTMNDFKKLLQITNSLSKQSNWVLTRATRWKSLWKFDLKFECTDRRKLLHMWRMCLKSYSNNKRLSLLKHFKMHIKTCKHRVLKLYTSRHILSSLFWLRTGKQNPKNLQISIVLIDINNNLVNIHKFYGCFLSLGSIVYVY